MLNMDVIEPAQTEWASPIVSVPKKDGILRLCVDHSKLKAVTIRDPYPISRMEEYIHSPGNATSFWTLDANSRLWPVETARQDRDRKRHLHLIKVIPVSLEWRSD